jgi:starvation-inducible DNA-binding protein
MQNLNSIGLDQERTAELAQKLSDLLANYSVFYQNTRGFHWNIKGDKFFELHQKFQDLYNDLLLKIDDVAERILTLGYSPDHRYTAYVQQAQIKESSQVNDGDKAVTEILDAFKMLLTKQRHLLELSAATGDEGTNALMSDYIREQEKSVWMYSAFLNRS